MKYQITSLQWLLCFYSLTRLIITDMLDVYSGSGFVQGIVANKCKAPSITLLEIENINMLAILHTTRYYIYQHPNLFSVDKNYAKPKTDLNPFFFFPFKAF